jgi:hypothetical protein
LLSRHAAAPTEARHAAPRAGARGAGSADLGPTTPTWIEREKANNQDAERKPGHWVVDSVQNKSLEVAEGLGLMV